MYFGGGVPNIKLGLSFCMAMSVVTGGVPSTGVRAALLAGDQAGWRNSRASEGGDATPAEAGN